MMIEERIARLESSLATAFELFVVEAMKRRDMTNSPDEILEALANNPVGNFETAEGKWDLFNGILASRANHGDGE